MLKPWIHRIRSIHDEAFARFDWDEHLAELNERLQLEGRTRFSTPAPSLPPIWFVGDIEAIEPHNWFLVLSLNPAYRPDEEWHTAQRYTADTYWDHWRLMYARYPEKRFNAPFVEIASAYLGTDIQDPNDFAAGHIVFVELCPYTSADFNHDPALLNELANTDPGFRRAAEIRDILLEEAQPAIVLANGLAAVTHFEQRYDDRLEWRRVEYESPSRPGKTLWHKQGVLRGERPQLAAGFPFLRKPQNHNSYAEIREIGNRLRELRQGTRVF